ncbi:transport protein BOS1 [Verticillium dahliae VdLs.17]|uniref:Protein transport protein BOS1 n=1 Tax=Verticillium dahliae (strain VdLs.17 / ATCC MYA-4575 / FGSC 10137) TaxID=498257 RepID=G2XDN8_VERDV|nr:transport protein BOS1 [Verticillium dahliae VdLs.17]EGY17106.1 transport protein BOS1 [Verticillium dahliae VdLs.17]KAF3351490.1 2-dehydro-3-deoxy-D-gluconate 5-dehydrogenase [Verticillium dahliae VDG2]KAH6696008.1 transport protein BOS1 [Verticillium dahliae]
MPSRTAKQPSRTPASIHLDFTPNVTYNSSLRQSKALRADIDRLSTATQDRVLTPAEIGSLSASLSSFSKTVDEYNGLARQELVPKKQEEALERVKRFKGDLTDFRSRIDTLKRQREDAAHQNNRAELLGRRPYSDATPENPYANNSTAKPSSSLHARGASIGGAERGAGGGGYGMGSGEPSREQHAFREQTFFANTNNALDEYIARGQAVLGDLGAQRDMLKNTQKKLYSVGNTLGISGDTIRMIERRAREDKWIFWAGVIIFFVFCWLCLHFLR